MPIDVALPRPWPQDSTFRIDDLMHITWLVGPNGTGKTRFLRALLAHPEVTKLRPRLLSADRLSGARLDLASRTLWGDRISAGLAKSHFQTLIDGNKQDGSIIGVIPLLYQRPDLRVRLEATLSQLLNRHISLEMADGNLVPRVRWGTSESYSMFADECHGVLELLVLLGNIYDDEAQLLLIDEPEQNLHPQYQAFVLDELLKTGKRAVLATHSPTFMRVRTLDDLRGVICFHEDFTAPSSYRSDPDIDCEVREVLPRMTDQHRSLFFATRPVVVEGPFDAAVISAIQNALGVSAEAAGSCIIPALGKEEAGRYLMLCYALGKKAVFLFDLDALFDQRLSMGANQNPVLAVRVAGAGHGNYPRFLGELQRSLTDLLTRIDTVQDSDLPANLSGLRSFIKANPGPNAALEKRRLALLVTISEHEADIRALSFGAEVDNVVGRFAAVREHLKAVDIHILPGGALENYLPSYAGNRFKVPDDAKRQTALAEVSWLAQKPDLASVRARYGDLACVVEALPAKPSVDLRPILKRELANLLHFLIVAIRDGHVTKADQAPGVLGEHWARVANFILFTELRIESSTKFLGVLRILDKFGIGERQLPFSQETQTNNPPSLPLDEVQGNVAAPVAGSQ